MKLNRLWPAALFMTLFLFILIVLSISAAADSSLNTYCANAASPDVCKKDVAVQKKDISICGLINSSSVRGGCFAFFAKDRNDFSLCEKIPKDEINGLQRRYKCYLTFVKTGANITICDDLIRTEREKKDCYDEILDIDPNIDVCFKLRELSGDEKFGSCISKVARKKKDQGLCSMITANIEKKICKFKSSAVCQDAIDVDKIYNDCMSNFIDEEEEKQNPCDSFSVKMEISMREKTKVDDLAFSGDAGKRRMDFEVGLYDVNTKLNTIGLYLKNDLNDTEFVDLPPFKPVKLNFINAQFISIETKTEGKTQQPVNYATICLYKDEPEKAEELKEEPKAEEKTQESIDENDAADAAEETDKTEQTNENDVSADNNSDNSTKSQEKKTDDQKLTPKVKKEDGIISRTFNWFKSFFW